MNHEIEEAAIRCPNGHDNPDGSLECHECRLPVVSCEQEISQLLGRLAEKAGYVVPHIKGSFVGVGAKGGQVVSGLYDSFGDEVSGLSFLNVGSAESMAGVPEIHSRGARFYRYAINETAVGGTIYCGFGEQAASRDTRLESYLHMSGVRADDASQTIFITASVGGGTGGGVAPKLVNLCKTFNREVSTLAVVTTPSSSEADHSHLNAFHGISRLITFDEEPNTDMILLLNHDRLRHVRGVGRTGEDLQADDVITYLLRLFELNLDRSGMIRMCRISKGAKIQAFVPCLAIGRSLEIFGNLANVLESAGIYPLANIDFDHVMASYLILRIPRGLAGDFPERKVIEEFEAWNKRHLPAVSSSLVQVLQTGEQSDRIDACILLGGDGLGNVIAENIEGYHRFKTSMFESSRWEEYGLSEKSSTEAEQVIDNYDEIMQALRESRMGA